jgi:RNA polymerase sigma-70 factor (ECF subfamily)
MAIAPTLESRTLNDAGDDRNGIGSGGRRGDDDHARDLMWLQAVAHGDRAAFERLYLHHHPRLARFLKRHTGRAELVDEIINETLWAVWRGASEFRGDSKVGTWIIGISYRCLMKSLRDQPQAMEMRSEEGGSGLGSDVQDDISEGDQRELRDWVQGGLNLLPREQRMTMELAYYFGQSCEEIAAIMHVAVGTVKARLFHARVRLRNTLPALGGETPSGTRSAGGTP